MCQSHVRNYMHLIFSTKYRQHLLDNTTLPELFSYMAGICVRQNCHPVKIGGFTNHVHVFFLLNKNLPLVRIVEEVKSHSSRWLKTKGPQLQNFYWQNGYGAFSVNPSNIDTVSAYIENQHHHHRVMTFEEEHRGFRKKYGVEWDERYVWD